MTLSGFPIVGFTTESLLLPGGQLHTRSKLSLLRNRAKKNIEESKDEIPEARRPGAFSVKAVARTPFRPQSLERTFFRGDGLSCGKAFGEGCSYKTAP